MDPQTESKGEDDAVQPLSKIPLVAVDLQSVSYRPRVKNGKNKGHRINVLTNISTSIRPGQLTAWMGPSGSGKTSLLSVAANLLPPEDIGETTQILVNGEPGRVPKRLVGVVWQDDLLLSNLTVQENLYYAARLKCTGTKTDDANRTVARTMETLGLSHVQHVRVGSLATRGISGGERKRVAVGAELVVRPSLLLLDEPTSGLDATTAQSLIQTLKELCTTAGHSIVVVIHQPRTSIYNLLDHLLLLSKGRAIYDGHPSKARAYLETMVRELPPETGLADWVMDIITEDEKNMAEGDDEGSTSTPSALATHWAKQDHPAFLLPETPSLSLGSLKELHAGPRFYTSRWTQLKLLTARSMKQQRGERLTLMSLILQLSYLLFTCLLWGRLPNTTGRVFERNSLLFFMLIGQANGIVIVAVQVFQRERTILSRERAKKLYAVSSFFLAKTATDMTNNVLLPLLYTMIVYWVTAFRPTATAFAKNVFAFYWIFSTAQSMGLFLSVWFPNHNMALLLAPPLTLFFVILGGFYIPYENLHPGVAWISFASFARYGYSALVINEYQGQDIPCSEDAVAIAIGSSGECPLPGEVVLTDLGIRGVVESYWFNIGMVVLLQVLFRIGAYVLLRRAR